MEQENKCQGGMCNGGKCGHGSCMMSNSMGFNQMHMHSIKWLVRIIMATIIFCVGVKFGELKGMLEVRGEGSYHRGGMMYGSNGGFEVQPYQLNVSTDAGTVAPAPSTAPKTKTQ